MRTVTLTKETTKDILENLLKRSPNQYGSYETAVRGNSCKDPGRGRRGAFCIHEEI